MEKNILRILGDIVAIQSKYQLNSRYNGSMIECLFKGGSFTYSTELKYAKDFEDIAKQLRLTGLDVEVKDCSVSDPASYHKTEYIDGKELIVKLPKSPAIEVLYAKR